MPYTSEYFDEGRGLLFVGSGIVTGSEIIAEKKAIATHEDQVRRVEYVLVDFRQVAEFPVSADDVRAIAQVDQRLAEMAPRAAIAIVAPMDVVFGVSRMWEVFAQTTGWPIGVFRARKDADDWLRHRSAPSR